MNDDADLLHKFAKMLHRFEGAPEHTPVSMYNSDAEEFVTAAQEHFNRPSPVGETQMISISHWGMFPVLQ